MGKAQRSGSLRWVKPSMTRLATCPGSGACSQVSTGANSHFSGLSLPPARRSFRYWTAFQADGADGSGQETSGYRRERGEAVLSGAHVQAPIMRLRSAYEPGQRGRDQGLGSGSQGGSHGGQVVQVPVLLGREVGVPVGEPR